MRLFFSFLLLSFVTVGWSQNRVLELDPGTNFVEIGDLDITGNNVTIEAWVKVEQYPTQANKYNIVSKHFDASNTNYLFRPNSFSVTTYDNGTTGATSFYQVSTTDSLLLNRWYHVAGVYNGSSLRFYINGCYKDEVVASGNLATNNILTAIGNRSGTSDEQLVGFLEDVRIWNVARTQNEIKNNLNGLPSSTQPGLVAHYLFNNSLANETGNVTFDGVGVNSIKYVNDSIPPFEVPEIVSLVTKDALCENSNEGEVYIISKGKNIFFDINNSLFRADSFYLNLFPDTFTINLYNSNQCLYDSEVGIIGFENAIKRTSQAIEICKGESVFVEGAEQTQAGIYEDTYTSVETGCDSVMTTELILFEPEPFLMNDREVCNVDSFEITSEYINTRWPDGSFGDSFFVKESGEYEARGISPAGCAVSDTVTITFITSEEINIPKAFTPNNDGRNDLFSPVLNVPKLPYYRFSIFDGWGKEIFVSQNENISWDGSIQGDNAPIGTYLWKLEYTPIECIQGQNIISEIGSVTLLR